MKNVGRNRKLGKALRGNSAGFTLIEVLIALALFSIIAIVFVGGLGTASRAVLIADVRTRAESLARSQMEYIKNQDYIDYSVSGHEDYDEIGGYTENYDVDIAVEPIDPATYEPYPYYEAEGRFQKDDGIQLITVTVTYYIVGAENKEVERQFTLEDYKREAVS